MKKVILISLIFALSANVVLSQDIIYTISGQYDEANIPLDSILIENITNGTKILFDDLPENPDYQINLTQKQYWGTTSIHSLNEETGFVVLQNMPGKLSLSYVKSIPTNINISVYNASGQKVYISGTKNIASNSIVRIEIESLGLFLVKLESPNYEQSFKTIGAKDLDRFSAEITSGVSTKKSLKSTLTIKNDEFNFDIGDSISIAAFKSGFYTPPIELEVTNSQSINFEFSKNYLAINNGEYFITTGFSIGYQGNSPSTLDLFSSGFNFNFQTGEILNGVGAIVEFRLKYTQEDLPSGTYILSTPEVMNTDTVCDTDINADGIITEDDCVNKLPDGKFYIDSEKSFYYSDFDIAAPNIPPLYFQSGSVIITRNEDFYMIEIDCTGTNGDIIQGFFAGDFYSYNYSY